MRRASWLKRAAGLVIFFILYIVIYTLPPEMPDPGPRWQGVAQGALVSLLLWFLLYVGLLSILRGKRH